MAWTPRSGGEWSQYDNFDERCVKFDVLVPDFEKQSPGSFVIKGQCRFSQILIFARDEVYEIIYNTSAGIPL